MKSAFEGKVVAIGGINGTGPMVTALINWLAQELNGRIVVVHSEDSGRLDAMGARQLPGMPFGVSKELDLFYELMARKINCEKIILPALKLGKTVLCQNWTIASRVNIQMNFPSYEQELYKVEEMSRGFDCHARISPDLSILLNPDPASCFERLADVEPHYPLGYYLHMQELYLEEIKKVPHIIVNIGEDTLYYNQLKAVIDVL